jgi:hypothetical protein
MECLMSNLDVFVNGRKVMKCEACGNYEGQPFVFARACHTVLCATCIRDADEKSGDLCVAQSKALRDFFAGWLAAKQAHLDAHDGERKTNAARDRI